MFGIRYSSQCKKVLFCVGEQLYMSDYFKSKKVKIDMDQTDIAYLIELLTGALRDEDWDSVIEANEFLKEFIGDDGGPIEFEE